MEEKNPWWWSNIVGRKLDLWNESRLNPGGRVRMNRPHQPLDENGGREVKRVIFDSPREGEGGFDERPIIRVSVGILYLSA